MLNFDEIKQLGAHERLSYCNTKYPIILVSGLGFHDQNKIVNYWGLIPDFLQDLKQLGLGTGEFTPLFSGAEYFARMWERCEQQKTKVR